MQCLNDVVIHRKHDYCMAQMDLYVNDRLATTVIGDGILYCILYIVPYRSRTIFTFYKCTRQVLLIQLPANISCSSQFTSV